MQSYLIYINLCLICVFFAHVGQYYKKKKWLIPIILLISLVSGLRDSSVGMDTNSYFHIFQSVFQGQIKDSYGEMGFKLLIALIGHIWKNENFVLFVIALITYSLIFLRLWDYEKYISLPWTVFCFYVAFYSFSLNGLRQMLAVALIFYASRYIKGSNYFLFLIAVFIALFIHVSALLGLLYIILELPLWKWLKNQKKALYSFIAMGGIGVLSILIFWEPINSNILQRIIKLLKYYKNLRVSNIGFMIPLKLVIAIVSPVLIKELCRIEKKQYKKTDFTLQERKDISKLIFEKEIQGDESYDAIAIQIYYILGCLLTFIGYFYLYVGRIGLYFYVFEAIYMGWIIKKDRTGFMEIMVACLFLYIFMADMLGNGQGHIPYLFFWQ